jgi:hypothetical protein
MKSLCDPGKRRGVVRRRGLLLVALVVIAAAGGEGAGQAATEVSPAFAACILSTHPFSPLELPGRGVRLGGLSDLAVVPDHHDEVVAWTLTDRGPNGTVGSGAATRRTLLAPDFTPVLTRFRLAIGTGGATPSVEAVLPLSGPSGKLLSGRPNGVGRDDLILDAASGEPLAADHDGIDTEGLVVMPDGSFWASEEYRPSLLRITPAGRVMERHVPAGVRLPESDVAVLDDLPAAYGDRRDNRGFEGLALSADATQLFVLLQSPLDHPAKGAAKQTGNVRLLVTDASSGRPVAEYVYRLGDPTHDAWATTGAPPDDGKLCALAALTDGSLVVLEQVDGKLARLYRVEPRSATDTLPRTCAGKSESLETIGDLEAAGITVLPKQLVADLTHLLPQMRADIGIGEEAAVKLEGIAMLDERRMLLVNDNDFGVSAEPAGPMPRSCVWVVALPRDLPAPPAHRTPSRP